MGHCPRACQVTNERIPTLGRQPLLPSRPRVKVMAREPIDGILFATISGTQGRPPRAPHLLRGKHLRRALWGKDEQPRKVYSPGLIARIALRSDPFDNSWDVLHRLANLGAEVLATIRHNASLTNQIGTTPMALHSHPPIFLLQIFRGV